MNTPREGGVRGRGTGFLWASLGAIKIDEEGVRESLITSLSCPPTPRMLKVVGHNLWGWARDIYPVTVGEINSDGGPIREGGGGSGSGSGWPYAIGLPRRQPHALPVESGRRRSRARLYPEPPIATGGVQPVASLCWQGVR